MMWGAKVKMPVDMPDDMLRDAISLTHKYLGPQDDKENPLDFETQGLEVAEAIKHEFDQKWTPHWHVIIGRNFGSFVTHETRGFLYFYVYDKAVMIFKAG